MKKKSIKNWKKNNQGVSKSHNTRLVEAGKGAREQLMAEE